MIDLKKLKSLRVKTGLNISQFAAKVGISTSHYSHIENGHTGPSVATLEAIVQVLGISIEDIINDQSERAADQIVFESSDGSKKRRFIMPNSPESYELVSRHIYDERVGSDSRLCHIIETWRTVSELEKEKIYKYVAGIKPETD